MPLRVELLGPSHPQGIGREVVYHVRRGGLLRYEVGLINVSRRPFTFRRCPIYTVSTGRTEDFVLNCRPTGTLRPGHRAVFEMRLRVRSAIGGFLWQLETANTPGADARVVVTR